MDYSKRFKNFINPTWSFRKNFKHKFLLFVNAALYFYKTVSDQNIYTGEQSEFICAAVIQSL